MISIKTISVIFALLACTMTLVQPNDIDLSNEYDINEYVLEEDTLPEGFEDIDHFLIFEEYITFNISNICHEM